MEGGLKTIGNICLVTILVGFLAAPGEAQTVKAPAGQTVAVPAEKKDYEAFDLGELYVRGERLATVQDVTDVVQISQEEIRATNAKTVAEALQYVPGIVVSTGRKDEPNIMIHGLDQSRALILIDGIPYYETYYGKLDLNQIPVENIARIDVEKGVSSVLWGPNGLAGVVNIITKKPTDKPSLDAVIEAGQYEAYRGSVSHGMKVGKFGYWLNYSHIEQEGYYLSRSFDREVGTLTRQVGKNRYPTSVVFEDGGVRDNADYRQDAIWAKFGIEPTPFSEYYLNFHYITREKGSPASIKDNTIFDTRPRFSNLSRRPDYDTWGLDFSGQQKITDAIVLKGKVYYHHHLDAYDSYSDPDFENKIAHSNYKDYLLGTSLLGEVKLGSQDTLRTGFTYTKESHEDREDAYLPYQEYISYTGSFSIENEFRPIKEFSLLAGIGYNWFEVTKAKQYLKNNAGDFTGWNEGEEPDDSQVTPMVGATYAFSDGTKLFGSLARKVRFPTLFQLYSSKGGNPNLEAEKSWNYVLGASRSIGPYAKAEINLFRYDIEDYIDNYDPQHLSQNENFAKIVIQGVELYTDIFPAKDLAIRFGYTYNHAEDKSDGALTHYVRNVPRHEIDASVKYLIPGINIKTDLSGRYVSETYGQLPYVGNVKPIIKNSDYTVFDLRIAKDIARNFEIYWMIKNIFDKDYAPEDGFPAPGRNMYLGMRASF
jgi:iron complex outermembrane recepter protein